MRQRVVLEVLWTTRGGGFENNYFTKTCSDYEAGPYLRLIDFVCHSPLGLRVMKMKKNRALESDLSESQVEG